MILGWRSRPSARCTRARGVWWCGGSERIVLDARADQCCVLVLDNAAMTLLFDVFGEWLG